MDEDSFDEDNFIELEIDSKLLELSEKPQLTGRKTITLRDLVSSLKKAKTKRCPICGRKMRRLYVKQGYRKVIRKTVKHKWKILAVIIFLVSIGYHHTLKFPKGLYYGKP